MVPGLFTNKKSFFSLRSPHDSLDADSHHPSITSPRDSLLSSSNATTTTTTSTQTLQPIHSHPDALPHGGLGAASKTDLSRARSVAKDVLKQVGVNVLKGSNLSQVTFPARCSEGKTTLEKFASTIVYADTFLGMDVESVLGKGVSKVQLDMRRMAHVVAFFVAGMHLGTSCLKPFNPVLGETLQVDLGRHADPDSGKLYMEQTSHHPPVARWFLKGKNYVYYGSSHSKASLGMNEVRIQSTGERIVKFNDGTTISFDFPCDVFSGCLFGTYTHNTFGTVTFTDHTNGIVATLNLGKEKRQDRSDTVYGHIYPPKNGLHQGDDLVQPLHIHGSWVSHLDVDAVRIWTYKDTKPCDVLPVVENERLPSDSSYRKDVQAVKDNDFEKAQVFKIEIEEAQRAERALRNARTTVVH